MTLATPQALLPGSLNAENAAAPRDHSASDLLKNLTFINTKDKNPGAPRFALALGRLTAQHHNPDRISQSHWIVFLDQTRLLWACYAYGIDDDDIQLDEEGIPGPYSTISDSAFGTKRENGQKVVFLGALEEIEFEMNKQLKNLKVHELDWSTSPLSDEQKLAMKVNVSKSKKEPVVKEENAEMKEFGTREPDILIKAEEDEEVTDVPIRSPPSDEVPDQVMNALQGANVTSADSSA